MNNDKRAQTRERTRASDTSIQGEREEGTLRRRGAGVTRRLAPRGEPPAFAAKAKTAGDASSTRDHVTPLTSPAPPPNKHKKGSERRQQSAQSVAAVETHVHRQHTQKERIKLQTETTGTYREGGAVKQKGGTIRRGVRWETDDEIKEIETDAARTQWHSQSPRRGPAGTEL